MSPDNGYIGEKQYEIIGGDNTSKNRIILSVLMIACFMLVSVPAVLGAPTPQLNSINEKMTETMEASSPGTWYYKAQVKGIFVATDKEDDVWAYISGVGWKEVDYQDYAKPTSRAREDWVYSSQVTNTIIALSNACANGKMVSVHVNNNGFIDIVYLWG